MMMRLAKRIALSGGILAVMNVWSTFAFVPGSCSNGVPTSISSKSGKFSLTKAQWDVNSLGPLYSSSSSSNNSNNSKSLSAAAKERRDEERRRRERKNDVVIGKTSAMPDARDYSVEPKATEEAWMRQASRVEQEIFRQTELGLEMLKMLRLEEAVQAFDRVFELRPTAYLWQAGIAKFYLNDLKGAANIFAQNAAIYESKFGEPASEERIWRDACELKFRKQLRKKDKKQVDDDGGESNTLAQVPQRDEMAEMLASERRKVFRITRDLFSASLEGNSVGEVLCRAKLRSICGTYEDEPRPDRKMWRLNAWYYLGLHYDVLGDVEESKQCMKMALRLCPSSSNARDIIHALPMLHMARRDWFDDEEFEEEPLEVLENSKTNSVQNASSGGRSNSGRSIRTDPVVIESIRTSISKLRVHEIQNALQTRGLKPHGAKDVLVEKLFQSLLEDAGLDS